MAKRSHDFGQKDHIRTKSPMVEWRQIHMNNRLVLH